MKILFTSVGRRVELIQAFRNASEKVRINLEIFGGDITMTAPALSFCDHQVILPRIKDPAYIPALMSVCRQEGIDALIPTIDTDLLLLSENRDSFENTKVIISALDKIKKCRDKRLTASFFEECGLKAPRTVDDYLEYKGDYPAFIKPKDGSSSISAYKVNNYEELKDFSEIVPDYIVQEFIEGTEYTVDVMCDLDGNPLIITPRIRLAVRSGEVLKTKIAQDDHIIEETRKIIEKFKPVGPITVQLIRKKETNDDYFIEINPRFGGGAPLSIKAGGDSAEALLRVLNGEKMGYQNKAAEDGAMFSRYDQSVRIY